MSFRAIKWALGLAAGGAMPPAVALLLVVLADHHNPELGCFPSQETLSRRLGQTERQVRRALQWLKSRGLIEVQCRGRRNGYTLNFDALNTGHRCPVSGEHIFTNTGHPCPVNTGHPCPVTVNDTGHPCPLVLTSKSGKDLNSNWKADDSVGTSAYENPQTANTDPEEDPGVEGELVKIEDVVNAHMAPKTEAEALADYAKSKARYKRVTAGSLAKLWRDLHHALLPNQFIAELTLKQRGQLQTAYRLAGEAFVQALPMVVSHWDDLLLYLRWCGVEQAKGLDSVNLPTPHLGLVVSCVQQVVQFSVDGPISVKVVQEVTAPDGTVVSKKSVTHGVAVPLTNPSLYLQALDKPSKEDALAMLEEALKGS